MKVMTAIFGGVKQIALGFISKYLTTLRRKAMAVAIPGLVFASIVYTVDAVRTEQAIMKEEIIKRAEVIADLASQIAVLPIISKNPLLIREAVGTLKAVSEVVDVMFFDANMKPLASAGQVFDQGHFHPGSQKITFFEDADSFNLYAPVVHEKTKDDLGLFIEQEAADRSKEIVGWVRIDFSKEHMKAARVRIIGRGLLIAVVFTLGSSYIVYKLFFLATQPLSVLSGAVKSLRNGKYPEVLVNSEDEIGDLAEEFNRMSNAINEREEMLVKSVRMAHLGSDIGIALTGSESLEEMLKRCAAVVASYTGADLVMLRVSDNNDVEMAWWACAGRLAAEVCPEKPELSDRTSAGLVARNKQVVISADAASDARFEGVEWLKKNDIRFYAGYPMIVESRLIGVMELFSQKVFDETLVNALDALSDQIAVGLERKIIEGRIRSSLSEKEMLLREVHHRVKNNMQVISSLLNLQSETISDRKYREMFNDSKNRIRAMALIHEKLYRTWDIENIDFHDYIESLSNGLIMFYGLSGGKPRLFIEAEGITLGIDTAIPCGLIINELLSNALKYAFPDQREGMIRIQMKKLQAPDTGGVEYSLKVSDNGIGMPADIDIRNTQSLGLHLVTSLAEHQLQGHIEVLRDGGTAFEIVFKDTRYRKRV